MAQDIDIFLADTTIEFSVVIPAHNRAYTLPACIESVLQQSFKNFEILVIDDCSNDNTQEILAKIEDKRVRYYRLVHNGGAQTARNVGIQKARGKWIAFLDSDDLWMQDKLLLQYEILKLHHYDETLFLYTDCIVRNERDNTQSYWDLARQNTTFLDKPGPMFQGMVTSKLALLQVGLLDNMILSYQEWDTSIALARICKIVHIPLPLFVYILHDGETISKNHRRDVLGYLFIIQKHRDSILELGTLTWNLHVIALAQRNLGFKFDELLPQILKELKLKSPVLQPLTQWILCNIKIKKIRKLTMKCITHIAKHNKA